MQTHTQKISGSRELSNSVHSVAVLQWPMQLYNPSLYCTLLTFFFVLSCCRMLQCVAVCCSVLQCAVVCCNVLQCVAVCCSVLQCVAACCSVLQCVAVCCSVLQCVAVCCSVLQRVAANLLRNGYKEKAPSKCFDWFCQREFSFFLSFDWRKVNCVSVQIRTDLSLSIVATPWQVNERDHSS